MERFERLPVTGLSAEAFAKEECKVLVKMKK